LYGVGKRLDDIESWVFFHSGICKSAFEKKKNGFWNKLTQISKNDNHMSGVFTLWNLKF